MQFKNIIGQKKVIDRLLKSYQENRVAHTQMFLGPEGSGTFALALAFAQYINCEQKQESDSCGVCASCVKFEKFSHPDLHFFFPRQETVTYIKDPWVASQFVLEFVSRSHELVVIVQRQVNLNRIARAEHGALKS